MTEPETPDQFDSAVATRRGDDGTTGLLFGGPRVRKDDLRTETYGTIDEAVAALGIARARTRDSLKPRPVPFAGPAFACRSRKVAPPWRVDWPLERPVIRSIDDDRHANGLDSRTCRE